METGSSNILEFVPPIAEGREVVAEQVEQEKQAQPAIVEYGFDLETFRYPGPWPEDMPLEDECKVYNGGGAKARELLSGNTQPVLAIRRNVWEEVQYLARESHGKEFACFLVLKPFDMNIPKYVAVDLYFPKQETGGTGVSIDAPSVNKFYEDLNRHADYKEHMHSRICHLHSHAGMATFWSGVDTQQQLSRDDLGFYDDFRYYVVINTHDSVRCSFVMYKPFLRRFDMIPLVVIGKEEGLSDERKAVLDGWLKERTKPLTTNVFADVVKFDASITEECKPSQRYTYTPYTPYAPYTPYKGRGGYDWRGRYDSADDYRSNWYGGEGRRYDWRKDTNRLDYKDGYAGYGEEPKAPKFRPAEAPKPRTKPAEVGTPSEDSVLRKFVDYCIGMNTQVDMVDETCVRDIGEALYEVGTTEAIEIDEILRDMSVGEKMDFYNGFMDLMGIEAPDPEDMAYSLVELAEWLYENDVYLYQLGGFIRELQG